MASALQSRDEFADGFWVGDWFVEPMLNRVRHQEEEEAVQLEPKVMEVLLCMAERPEKTITKEQFKENVWTDTVVTDDVLSRCISELRKVFDDDSRDPSYIETIRKTGYRLIAPVRIPDSEETSPKSESPLSGEGELEASDARGVVDQIASNLEISWTNARDSWVVVAGGIVDRKWIIGLVALLVAILAVSVVSWSGVDIGTASRAPAPTTPFTTFPGEEFDPALSASGQQVVFAWRNADSLYQNIYLMQQGADRPLRLSSDQTIDSGPTWSPDGRFVAYIREAEGEHKISIVPSIGGQGRVVSQAPNRQINSVSWSPDTSQTVLAASIQQRPHQAFGLDLLLPDADSTRALTKPPLWSVGDTRPVFSPDGSEIAFIRGHLEGVEDVFVVPTDGGEVSQVTTDSTTIHGLTWSSDGDDTIYSAHRGGVSGLWRVDSDGGTPTLLRPASEGTVLSHPTASSNRLAYTQRSPQLDIWTLRRSSRYDVFHAGAVVSSTQNDEYPSISPDGSRIAFVSERSGNPEVWVSNVDGSAASQITSLKGPDVRSIAWSSDGEQLSLVTRKGGVSNLYVVPASGGPLSQITDGSAEVDVPRWSRNDRWIYYASTKTGGWEIWRTSPETSRTEQVTTGGAVAAQESEAGSVLYVVRSDTTGVWAAQLDTTRFPLRTGRQPSADSSVSTVKLTSSSTGTAEARPEEATDFDQVITDVKPRDRENWWVEGEGIYFLDHRRFRTAVLTFHDFQSGRAVPLYTFTDWQPNRHVAVGPRGDLFAYTHVERRESDVMLIEDVEE